MNLWLRFWFCVNALRPAFSRHQTFCLFVLALVGMCVRTDHAGVTSFVRALGLEPLYYRRLLHLFSSDAWSVEGLTKVWVGWVMRVFGQFKVNGRYVLVADGIKAPREGRRNPEPAIGGRGRPRKYGAKIKLKDLFADRSKFRRATVAGYGAEEVEIEFYAIDLLWKPIARVVRFILVVYPGRGKCIFVSTDLDLDPLEAIAMYTMRFKIEVSFKQAVRTIGAFAYHFWLKSMPRIKRRSGNQYLHRQSADYRQLVEKKLESYHKHVMVGLVAQGCMQYLSTYFPTEVYAYAPWLRTKTMSGHPSEETVAAALRAGLSEFLARTTDNHPLKKIFLPFHRGNRATQMAA